MTGFEQVVRDNIPTYYVVDLSQTSRVVTFNRNWRYQNKSSLPYAITFAIKYVNGYFYFSSNDYFYKTDSNFNLISNYNRFWASYRGIYYHSKSALFFVSPSSLNEIHVFDTNCGLQASISTPNFKPYAINNLHGNFYVGQNVEDGRGQEPRMAVLKKDMILRITSKWNINCGTESRVVSITFDSLGFMLVSCEATNKILLYDTNGNYLNSLQTLSTPYATAIDHNGRLVIMTGNSLDIYY